MGLAVFHLPLTGIWSGWLRHGEVMLETTDPAVDRMLLAALALWSLARSF